MAALKDPRQEKFCRLMAVGGKTQEQAAIEAGCVKAVNKGAHC